MRDWVSVQRLPVKVGFLFLLVNTIVALMHYALLETRRDPYGLNGFAFA